MSTSDDFIKEAVSKASEIISEKTEESETPDNSSIEVTSKSEESDKTEVKTQPSITDAQTTDIETPQEADSDEEAATETTTEESESAEDSGPPIQAPEFWGAEEKEAFAKAAPVLKNALRKEYERVQGFARRIAKEAEAAKTFQNKSYEATQAIKNELNVRQMSPVEFSARATNWQVWHQEDPIRAAAEWLKSWGVSPYDLLEEYQNTQRNQSPEYDEIREQLETIRRENEELKSWKGEQDNAVKAQADMALRHQVEAFKQRKDSRGVPLAQNWDFYEPQIAAQAATIKAQAPDLPLQDLLNRAYNNVMFRMSQFGLGSSNPLNGNSQPEPAKKPKVASSSTKGSPISQVEIPKGLSIDDAARMASKIIDY